MAEVMLEVDRLKGPSVHDLATIVGSLLLIIGCDESLLESQNESDERSITAEPQSVLLI